MRLIDADALIKKWENVNCEDVSFEMAVIGAINDIKKEPTVDAVPVIRCKDCKYYTGKWCTKFSTKQFDINDICKADDDFCSMAERKEHESD